MDSGGRRSVDAVVIGGGYATGRELAEFFLPSGPRGGLAALLVSMTIWSAVCAATFAFAYARDARDYRSLFKELLGPGWIIFEIAYGLLVVLLLAVFGAAAGAIGAATFGWPQVAGTVCLMIGIACFTAFGNSAVEGLFKYVTYLLYGVYALFTILALTHFGDRILANLAVPAPVDGWALGGITYASYNIVGAVVILPALRHLTSRRDAVIAGLIAGPLAMIPALLFFISMIAFYPGIAAVTLPSDFLLARLDLPMFHLLFQLMIFAALLESGTGALHAINERIARSSSSDATSKSFRGRRLLIAASIMILCMFIAERVGLVTLIAAGYRALACVFLAIYILPLFATGVLRALKRSGPSA